MLPAWKWGKRRSTTRNTSWAASSRSVVGTRWARSQQHTRWKCDSYTSAKSGDATPAGELSVEWGSRIAVARAATPPYVRDRQKRSIDSERDAQGRGPPDVRHVADHM